jgi:hypothetical protein
MKAWKVEDREGYENYCTIVFAETREKARILAMGTDACEDASYINIRAVRVPDLDQFYRGLPEMDWYNGKDRTAMVRYADMCCADDVITSREECNACVAHEWCLRYDDEERG